MAYATSFLTVGIIWINHHAALSRLRVADHAVLVLNMPMAATERHRLLVRDIGGAIPYVLATALAPPSRRT